MDIESDAYLFTITSLLHIPYFHKHILIVRISFDVKLCYYTQYYNYYQNDVDVPFKIVVAKEQVSNLSKNYTINPNNIVQSVNSSIKESQKIIGLLITTSKECRFYFAESYVGNSITSSNKEFVKHSKQYLANYYKNTITLKEILEMAGAILVEDRESCDIDLSPEKLQKNTILNLLI